MTRADAALWLAGSLGPLLADAGIGTTDATGELKEPIDAALLLTGVSYADLASATIDDGDVLGLMAVLRWQALEAVWAATANRVTVSKSLGSPSVSKSESRGQIVDNVAKLLEQARAAAQPYVTTGTNNSWQAPGRLALDIYEGCWEWPS